MVICIRPIGSPAWSASTLSDSLMDSVQFAVLYVQGSSCSLMVVDK